MRCSLGESVIFLCFILRSMYKWTGAVQRWDGHSACCGIFVVGEEDESDENG